MVPGDVRPEYPHASQARQILNDAEDDLREWRLDGVVLLGDDAKTVVNDNSQVSSAAAAAPGKEKNQAKQKDKQVPKKQEEVDGQSVAETEGGGV